MNPYKIKTLELDNKDKIDWFNVQIPKLSLPIIQKYTEYIDYRITNSINNTVQLSPQLLELLIKGTRLKTL